MGQATMIKDVEALCRLDRPRSAGAVMQDVAHGMAQRPQSFGQAGIEGHDFARQLRGGQVECDRYK
jgi:hypothetical protein